MAKINKPHNLDEIKKRGSTDRHIVKRVADTSSGGKIDSEREDEILEAWVENIIPEHASRFQPYDGRYPAVSNNRLKDYVLTYKEVEMNGYRIDSIIRYPDGNWELVEVKTSSGLGLGVIGHILSKSTMFENKFTVKSANVEMTILTDGSSKTFEKAVSGVNRQCGVGINIKEINI